MLLLTHLTWKGLGNLYTSFYELIYGIMKSYIYVFMVESIWVGL